MRNFSRLIRCCNLYTLSQFQSYFFSLNSILIISCHSQLPTFRLSIQCLAACVTDFKPFNAFFVNTLFLAARCLSTCTKSFLLLFLSAQGDNGDEDLAPTEVDGQFEFQAKDNLPPGGFKFC